jgi:hypothetical protein
MGFEGQVFFPPISWAIKLVLGNFYILLYNLVPIFWKFQKLKNPYFNFFNVQNKMFACSGSLNSKKLVIRGMLFEGFFFWKTTVYD